MPISARIKRVTDPLDDRVKDQIVGRDRRQQPAYVSSGSEHSAGSGGNDDVSSSSPCLSELLDCFLHHEEDDDGCNSDDEGFETNGNEIDSDLECDYSDRTDATIKNLVSVFMNQNVDGFRNVLLENVLKATKIFESPTANRQTHHRNVMLFLQNNGYNASICKTKWQSCGGLTSGTYEFIDVVRSDSGTRYFIDLNFAGEFNIARETTHFRRLYQQLPAVFVGKSEDLKQVVKLLSDAARCSLKTRGLLLPPWRKKRFMQNKWFGPYRRTVNYTPANVLSASMQPKPKPTAVKCRSIGFNVVGNSNAPLYSAAARTR